MLSCRLYQIRHEWNKASEKTGIKVANCLVELIYGNSECKPCSCSARGVDSINKIFNCAVAFVSHAIQSWPMELLQVEAGFLALLPLCDT